jgi:hypothetical protein
VAACVSLSRLSWPTISRWCFTSALLAAPALVTCPMNTALGRRGQTPTNGFVPDLIPPILAHPSPGGGGGRRTAQAHRKVGLELLAFLGTTQVAEVTGGEREQVR